eukprot:7763949-Karenia_brevis.AAC.1
MPYDDGLAAFPLNTAKEPASLESDSSLVALGKLSDFPKFLTSYIRDWSSPLAHLCKLALQTSTQEARPLCDSKVKLGLFPSPWELFELVDEMSAK